MKYYVKIEKEGNLYVASVPDLNNTSTYGDSIEEALLNAQDAAELYVEDVWELPENKYISDYFVVIS